MFKALLSFPVRIVDDAELVEILKKEERTELKAMEYELLPNGTGISFNVKFDSTEEAIAALEAHFLAPEFALCATDETGQRVGYFHPEAVAYQNKGEATITGTFTE